MNISLASQNEVTTYSADISKDMQSIEVSNDFFRNKYDKAVEKFEKLNIESAYIDFTELIENTQNDYFLLLIGCKTAELGLFDLSNASFAKIKDYDISETCISETKRIYYPKKNIKRSDLTILAEIYSNIKYNDNAFESVKELKSYTRLLNEYDYANYILAFGYYSLHDYDNAKIYIESALKNNPENMNYKILKSLVFFQEKQGKVSKKIMNNVQSEKILTLRHRKKINSAKEFLYYTLSKQESDKDFYLGRYYYSENDYSRAVRILQGAICKNKTRNASCYGIMSKCSFLLNDMEKAKELALKSLRNDKNNQDAYVILGDIESKNCNYKNALKYYRLALSKADRTSKKFVLEKLALAYMNLSDSKKAQELYDNILKHYPDSYFAYYKMSTLDSNKEIDCLKKTVSINMDYSDAWIDLARIMLDKGNLELARNYLRVSNYIEEKDNFRYYYYQNVLKTKEQELINSRNSKGNKGINKVANEI